jgi:hypothetical protein
MNYSALALSLFLFAPPAQAQTAGQSCTNFGQETMAADGTDLDVCLYTSESDHSLIWKASAGGDDGGSYILSLTNMTYSSAAPSSVSGTCTITNPQTGGCSCPSGYTPAAVSAAGYAPPNNNDTPYVAFNCVIGTAATTSSPPPPAGGSYATGHIDCNGYGTTECVTANSSTGGCSCPDGTTATLAGTSYAPFSDYNTQQECGGNELLVISSYTCQ